MYYSSKTFLKMGVSVGTAVFLFLALFAALNATVLAAPDAPLATSDLFFSEYIEGSSNNKALEIYNDTGATVDLTEYRVNVYSNGSATPNYTHTFPAATTLADGDVYVLANSSAAIEIINVSDETSTVTYFNGDDAVALKHNDTLIDVIGVIGSDPGSFWGEAPTTTANNTIVRKNNVCAGQPAGFPNPVYISNEWLGFPSDTFSYLGSHTANCVTQLSINKEVTPNTNIAHQSTITYTVVLANGTAVDETAVLFTDTLPISTTFASWVEQPNGASQTSGEITWTGTVTASESVTFTFTANQTADYGETITNTAEFSGTVVGTAQAAFVVENEPQLINLALQKTGPVAALVGETINYTVIVTNDGTLDAEGVLFTDTFPAEISYVSDDSGLTPTTPSANVYVWDLGTMAQGTAVTIQFTGTITNNITSTTLVTNTAEVSTSSVGDDTGDNISEAGTTLSTFDKIHDIQGSGSTAAAGTFTVEAIVVGDYQGVSGVNDYKLDGFFIQEEDADVDGDPATSEGIFVFCLTCPTDVNVGDLVQVTGSSSEYFNMSQLSATSAQAVTVISSSNTLPGSAAVTLPVPGVTATDLAGAKAQINAYYEPFEGMLVTVNEELTVTEYFELSRYGQVVLAQNGRFRQFTDAFTPSIAGYTAHQIDKARRTVILDDDSNQQNHALFEGVPVFHPQPGFSITNYFRGGDTIADLTGVLHWSFAGQTGTDAWRIRPVTEGFDYDFTAVNTRTVAPENVGGNLKVASFNVLNYFTTLDARGADSIAELDRQAAKITAAFAGLDADVIGVMEIENNNDVAIADLVSRLNADAGAGTYAFISTGTVGTDEITVGIIYKPASVTPVGTVQILTDAAFTDPNNTGLQRSRPAVAHTFETVDGEQFTVVVNHLKSKGCGGATGADADQGDGQGCWNDTRQKSATYLVNTWIPALTISIGDPDFLIMGDLNSYRNEDPITNITDAGYSDLFNDLLGASAYGYVFDGQLGYLDHALASPSLAQQVTGVSEWHINADEVNLLDYNDTILDPGEASFEVKPGALPLFESNTYRSSDHDPVLVGLFAPVVTPTVAILSPMAGEIFTSTNGTAVSVPVTITTTDFVIPTNGHWHLWIDGVDTGPVMDYETTVDLLPGAHVISAELNSPAHVSLGFSDSVSVTVNVQYFLYLPVIMKP